MVARELDAMLDGQMTGQARIAAHFVAAAEAAGQDAPRVLETLDAIASATVLDEFWITDEQGFAYLTNVRDASGERITFRFNPDPEVQPQASVFHELLGAPLDGNAVITQRARVREIDNEIYKYVGVGGIDRHRIVQVGNALAFEEQVRQSGGYTSPVMTAVMAAFGEPDLLEFAFTEEFAEIRSVFESILGQQMIVQATLVDHFVAGAEAAGWSTADVDERLRRIVQSSPMGEFHVAAQRGDVLYSSRQPSTAASAAVELPHADELDPIRSGTARVVDHPVVARPAGDVLYRHVSVASTIGPRFVQVGCPLDDKSLVSPRYQPPDAEVGGATL